MTFFLQLFLAHLLGDFFLQPSKWVNDKEAKKLRSPYLYLHALIHFGLVIILTVDLHLWPIALVTGITHLFIDATKILCQKQSNKRTWFFIDQGLHLLVILAITYFKERFVIDLSVFSDPALLIFLTAILFLLHPSSFVIKNIISKWAPSSTTTTDTLQSAGKWIGCLERLLIFTFLIYGKWEGVGFLLAAKSIFRFGDLRDAKETKLTEYVLIGTLLSFGLAIIVSLATISLADIKI